MLIFKFLANSVLGRSPIPVTLFIMLASVLALLIAKTSKKTKESTMWTLLYLEISFLFTCVVYLILNQFIRGKQETNLAKKWLKHRESRFKAITDGLNCTNFKSKGLEFKIGEYSSYIVLKIDSSALERVENVHMKMNDIEQTSPAPAAAEEEEFNRRKLQKGQIERINRGDVEGGNL